MAQSKYEYVKSFEKDDRLPQNNWIVIRIYSKTQEANDAAALSLVDDCLKTLLRGFFDAVCAYGAVNECSFVFHRSSDFFNRRASKLVSVLVSSFTSLYVRSWPAFLPEKILTRAPVFRGAAYCYPEASMVRSYLSSRQNSWKVSYPDIRSTGAFAFKRKVDEETEVVSEDVEVSSDAFWNEHWYILQAKQSKRSIIKARQRGIDQVPKTVISSWHGSIDLEQTSEQTLPPNNWIVVRIDGRGFKKFADVHEFTKPNDEQALRLMDECAQAVLEDDANVVCAYGISDEFSFVIRENVHQQASELISTIVSLFTATYVMRWPSFFPEKKLKYAPAFDARAVCYPTKEAIRDYLAWRQVDCHINNVNNTCFWKLRELGLDPSTAHSKLIGTRSSDKQELLSNKFHVQYSDLPAKYRRGSFLVKQPLDQSVIHYHDCDIIGDDFWREHRYILEFER